ncbi:MAG: hypothetical protein KDE27_17090 [Planctomycetes bacterium]|nr:hypothetical protein [Planctomycetota bacterium]
MTTKTETLDEILELARRKGETLEQWCERKDFPERTLRRMRSPYGNVPRRGTVKMLAIALTPEVGGTLKERIARVFAATRARTI